VSVLSIKKSDFTKSEIEQLEMLAKETGQTVEVVIADLTSLHLAQTKEGLLGRQKIGPKSSCEVLDLPIACRTLN